MPILTRRRSPDHRQECWEVYYGERTPFEDPIALPGAAGLARDR
jgi:hypothetical protein